MQRINSRSTTPKDSEDISGQVGWMYTDLLLGLMVIFLATITFIPQGRVLIDKNTVQTYNEIVKTPLALRYNNFNFALIKKDIDDFTTKQGIKDSYKIARLQIVGSYDPTKEDASAGIARAVEINNKISIADSKFVAFGTTSLGAFADKATENFVLEFTFQVQVQVLRNTTP